MSSFVSSGGRRDMIGTGFGELFLVVIEGLVDLTERRCRAIIRHSFWSFVFCFFARRAGTVVERAFRINESKLLGHLSQHPEGSTIGAMAKALGLDQSPVAAACQSLADQGLVSVNEEPWQELSLGDAGRAQLGQPLPEQALARALIELGAPAAVPEMASRAKLPPQGKPPTADLTIHGGLCARQGAWSALAQPPPQAAAQS